MFLTCAWKGWSKQKVIDEEKERQKEIREKLESEGLDPDEFDEDEQEQLADLL